METTLTTKEAFWNGKMGTEDGELTADLTKIEAELTTNWSNDRFHLHLNRLVLLLRTKDLGEGGCAIVISR